MPTNVAEIFLKGTSDNTLVLDTRCQMSYPLSAPNWMDLRVGFFLSVCSTAVDDPPSPITGLAESIAPDPLLGLPPQDLFWAGIKTNNDSLPYSNNVGFIGYSNSSGNNPGLFSSDLVSSDGGIGTTNNNFWRPRTLLRNNVDGPNAMIIDGSANPFSPRFTNVQQHFAQVWDGTSAFPYATLLMLRIRRPNPTSTNLTVTIKQGTNSGDVLFTNTPSANLLENNLSGYPTVVQTVTIVSMRYIPDSIFLYWPFHQSRLRCHALGFMKFA